MPKWIIAAAAALLAAAPARAEYVMTIYADPPSDGHWGHAQVRIQGSSSDGNPIDRWYGWNTSPNGFELINSGMPDAGPVRPDLVPSVAVPLTDGQFATVTRVMDAFQTSTLGYNAALNNCVTFVREAASAVGLNVPSDIGKLPSEFMADLMRANPSRVMTPTGAPAARTEVEALARRATIHGNSAIYETRARQYNSYALTLQNRFDRIMQAASELIARTMEEHSTARTAQFAIDNTFNRTAYRETQREAAASWRATENAVERVAASAAAAAGGRGFEFTIGGSGGGDNSNQGGGGGVGGTGGGGTGGSGGDGLEGGHNGEPGAPPDGCWGDICYHLEVPIPLQRAPRLPFFAAARDPNLLLPEQPGIAIRLSGATERTAVSFISMGNFLHGEEASLQLGLSGLNLSDDQVLLVEGDNVSFIALRDEAGGSAGYESLKTYRPSELQSMRFRLSAPPAGTVRPLPRVRIYRDGELIKTIYFVYTVFGQEEILLERSMRMISGLGREVSQEYRLCSGPPPPQFQLVFLEQQIVNGTRDRDCSSWANCRLIQNDGQNACFGYMLQGHDGGIRFFSSEGGRQVVHATAVARFRYQLRRPRPQFVQLDKLGAI